MIVHIPTKGMEHDDIITQTLDGVDYVFRFLWNSRNSHWYLRIETQDETLILGDIKIVADSPLLAHRITNDMPPGELWCITSSRSDPGLLDLGDGAELYYVEEDSVT